MMMTDAGSLATQYYAKHFKTMDEREILLMSETRVFLLELELVSKTRWTQIWNVPFSSILQTKFVNTLAIFQTDQKKFTVNMPQEEVFNLDQWWTEQNFSKKAKQQLQPVRASLSFDSLDIGSRDKSHSPVTKKD